ncbi:MAG: hypothetical protein JWN23_1804 [Rhodocyclales bacterium]|nr:hypothetical protein [Rhodocyclales bacterium]
MGLCDLGVWVVKRFLNLNLFSASLETVHDLFGTQPNSSAHTVPLTLRALQHRGTETQRATETLSFSLWPSANLRVSVVKGLAFHCLATQK